MSLHSELRGLEASFLDREKSFSASSCPSHPQDSDRPVQGSSFLRIVTVSYKGLLVLRIVTVRYKGLLAITL